MNESRDLNIGAIFDGWRTPANWGERLRNYSLSAINYIQAARCLLISRLDGSAEKRQKSNEDWMPEGECYVTDTSLSEGARCAIDRWLIDRRRITGHRIKARNALSSFSLFPILELSSSLSLFFAIPFSLSFSSSSLGVLDCLSDLSIFLLWCSLDQSATERRRRMH